MQSTTMLTDLQRKFLVQMNSYHRSIANDRTGNLKMNRITNLRIDNQSLLVTYSNIVIFRYSSHGSITQIK